MDCDMARNPDRDGQLDEALAESFPASDPVAFVSTAIATLAPITDAPMKKADKDTRHKLYGAKGGGSMIVEAAFAFADLPVEIIDLEWDDTGWESKTLKELNPLGQVPTLILPNGQVMTESAAIILHLADAARAFALVPSSSDEHRPAFLRWLVFLVAAVYPTYTYGDTPGRWVGGGAKEGAGKLLREATDEHRKKLWRYVEGQISGPWFLGEKMSALDVYVWVMSFWRPGKDWLAVETPKLCAIAEAMRKQPICKKIAARNGL